MPTLTLRPANDDDSGFVFAITQAVMRVHVEQTWGRWDTDEQQERHRNTFDSATHQLVLVDGEVAGVLAVEHHATHLRLDKLYLLPAFCNQGIGTVLLQGVLEQAALAAKPVRLRVLAVNRSAQRFYARHGFTTTQATTERHFMEAGQHPELETPRLCVRLVTGADLPALLEVNGDDAVTRFLPYESWRTMDDALAWYQRVLGRHAAGTALQYVVLDKATDRVIGSCLLFQFDEGSARAELGYVLGRESWGSGRMGEALQALVGHAFGRLGVRRLEAEVDPRNGPSLRLLERLGFVREGLLRQRWVNKGVPIDVAAYGLLRDEWSQPA